MRRNLFLLLVCIVLVAGGAILARWFPAYYYHSLFTAFGLGLLIVTLFGKDTYDHTA